MYRRLGTLYLLQAFQHMVQDGSDSLTVEDIRAVCLSVGLRLTAEELQVSWSLACPSIQR